MDNGSLPEEFTDWKERLRVCVKICTHDRMWQTLKIWRFFPPNSGDQKTFHGRSNN